VPQMALAVTQFFGAAFLLGATWTCASAMYAIEELCGPPAADRDALEKIKTIAQGNSGLQPGCYAAAASRCCCEEAIRRAPPESSGAHHGQRAAGAGVVAHGTVNARNTPFCSLCAALLAGMDGALCRSR